MRVHHLNCGTCRPAGGRLFDGVTDGPLGRLVCHCLLVETGGGLVLVDTGFGVEDVETHGARLSPLFQAMNNIQLIAGETAAAQVRSLGFRTRDVRHIVLTHLDFDHAGGLEDFPDATVHVLRREKVAADAADGGVAGEARYRAAQWNGVRRWRLYDSGAGERWFGFEEVRSLAGLPPEILFVPLAGHTWGHAGVAIDGGPEGWLLHAGDAYFFHGEIGGKTRLCPPGLRAYQTLMHVDGAAWRANQDRLRALSITEKGRIRIFSAHDPTEFELLATSAPDLNAATGTVRRDRASPASA